MTYKKKSPMFRGRNAAGNTATSRLKKNMYGGTTGATGNAAMGGSRDTNI